MGFSGKTNFWKGVGNMEGEFGEGFDFLDHWEVSFLFFFGGGGFGKTRD